MTGIRQIRHQIVSGSAFCLKLLKAGMPGDCKGRFLLFLSLFISAGIYWLRVRTVDVLFPFYILCWVELCFVSLVATVGIWALKYILEQNGHPLSLVFLLSGVILGIFWPLPPRPEEALFSSHKTEYEELVKLAQEARLDHSERCHAPHSFASPPGYELLVKQDTCILVERVGRQTNALVVEFYPRDFYWPIVYLEDPRVIGETYGACHGDGRVYKQLDEHWFLCRREWN